MNALFTISPITLALLITQSAIVSEPLFAEPQAEVQSDNRRAAPGEESQVNSSRRSPEVLDQQRESLLTEEKTLIRRIDEVEQELAREENPEKAERLRAELAGFKQRIVQIWREIDEINLGERQEMEFPEPVRRQLEELHVAAENLREVGMDREADQLIAEADALMDRHHHTNRFEDEGRIGHRRMDELTEEVGHLRHQVEQLRAEIDEMYDLLDNALGLDESFDPLDRQSDGSGETSNDR